LGWRERGKKDKKSSVYWTPSQFERLQPLTTHGGFQVIIPELHEARKQGIQQRLKQAVRWNAAGQPILSSAKFSYEAAQKTQAINVGGIGLIHKLAVESGLIEAINNKLQLLKMYFPYRESDHVLNIAYNAICGGQRLEDIELRRNDETYLDALGAESIPDPTTAGDFCRRFDAPGKIGRLHDAIDEARLNVWRRQPDSFFDEAIIEMDGHLLETTGSCKEGMDVAYNGKWGYHPLLVSLANTSEVLSILNRSGNSTSFQDSVSFIERAIGLCRRGGFRRIVLRGDSKFSQTKHFDRWHDDQVRFQFSYDAKQHLVEIAENLPQKSWHKLQRPARYQVQTNPRQRPDNVKREVIRRREFEVLHQQSEEVAEFDYQPLACQNTYRMIVVRKNISHEKGERRLFDEIRYLFYITNDPDYTPAEVVFACNDRCHQENLIAQLSGGVRALRAPVDNLLSNWAYMVMTALAWNLKAWAALTLPETGRWARKHRAEKQTVLRWEFRTFLNYFINVPCQIVRTGRRIVYRLLNWNPWSHVFRRLSLELKC
jgi:hypothetical protein